ncbi:MAG: 4Fe-4S dicluster domain-containing protein [Candidatus Omnitrophica bacterium]|nr:4Fe-4S dicluster domain-containing protein [Candidatus Omnitrophota bacterium]
MAKIKINTDQCKGCRLCIHFCPVHHLRISEEMNNKGVLYACTDPHTRCIGCGYCYLVCPESCIEVHLLEPSETKKTHT